MESTHILLNVGGKRYETTTTTIGAHPGTLLEMLVRRKREDDMEIFLDRDGPMFRWILYWYRTGMLVDHNIVGVPKEVWLHELDYYGIGGEEQNETKCLGEMSPRKRKTAETEEEIRNRANTLASEHAVKEEQDKEKRHVSYLRIANYMIKKHNTDDSSTWFDFVGFANGQGGTYPYSYPHEARFNPAWLDYWFKEFQVYCKETLNINVAKKAFSPGTTVRRYNHEPGQFTDIRTKHSDIRLTLSL